MSIYINGFTGGTTDKVCNFQENYILIFAQNVCSQNVPNYTRTVLIFLHSRNLFIYLSLGIYI